MAALLWVSWEVGAGVLGAVFWAQCLCASDPPRGSAAARKQEWECQSQSAGSREYWLKLGWR